MKEINPDEHYLRNKGDPFHRNFTSLPVDENKVANKREILENLAKMEWNVDPKKPHEYKLILGAMGYEIQRDRNAKDPEEEARLIEKELKEKEETQDKISRLQGQVDSITDDDKEVRKKSAQIDREYRRQSVQKGITSQTMAKLMKMADFAEAIGEMEEPTPEEEEEEELPDKKKEEEEDGLA